jgi:hypothetical protein
MCLLPFGFFAFSVFRISLAREIRGRWIYITVLFGAWLVGVSDPFAIGCLGCLLSVLAVSAAGVIDLIILGIVGALALSVKLNSAVLFLACCAVVAMTAAQRLRGRTTTIVFVSVLPIVVAGFFFLANGMDVMPELLRGAGEVIGGYSEGMALPGRLWVSIMAVGALSGFLIIPALVAERRVFAFTFITGLIVAFYALKNSMVRQDGHALPFHFQLALALAIAATGVQTRRAQSLVFGFALLNVYAGIEISTALDPAFFTQTISRVNLVAPVEYVKAWVEWPRTWASLAGEYRRTFEALRLPPDINAVVGRRTVAAVPYAIDHVIANGWNWRPRPVFQDYFAYTPYLDRLNATHADGQKGAELILLSWGAIDGRHMFFEDPASWIETISHYRVRLTHSDFSLLERRTSPLLDKGISAGRVVTGWHEPLKVPSTSDLLVMHADVQYSAIGALRKFLFRATPVFVDLTRASGTHESWRAVQSNLQDGALINYLPDSVEDLALITGERKMLPDPVISLQFETGHPTDYKPEIQIYWERRPARPDSVGRMEKLQQLWAPRSGLPIGVDTRIIRTADGIRVSTWTDDPQLTFFFHRDLRPFGRIVIRAKFQKRDYINLFFSQQFNGRGLDAMVPVAGKWLDVIFDVSMNPFWSSEAGDSFRFDPSSGVRINAIDIAGIWGILGPTPDNASPVEFRPVLDQTVVP